VVIRKKRRRRIILKGEYNSPKCSAIIKYRSGLELQFCIQLDRDPEVESYEYESIIIPYKRRPTNSKISKYTPDFIVKMTSGLIRVIEIKPQSKIKNKVVQTKAEWAKEWCERKGFVYEFVTEKSITISRSQAILLLEENKKWPKQIQQKRNLSVLF